MSTLNLQKLLSGILVVAVLQICTATTAQATTYFRGYAENARHSYGCYMAQHPKVHAMVKDGAIGTAAGALVGLASGRGIMHGALMGAGAGAGIGALRTSSVRYTHPVATNVGTAAIAGLGLFLAAKHGHGLL